MEEIDLLSRALTVRSKDVAQWFVQSADEVSQNPESKGEEPAANDNVRVFATDGKSTSYEIFFYALVFNICVIRMASIKQYLP